VYHNLTVGNAKHPIYTPGRRHGGRGRAGARPKTWGRTYSSCPAAEVVKSPTAVNCSIEKQSGNGSVVLAATWRRAYGSARSTDFYCLAQEFVQRGG
jgi:hypothetical protein